MSSKMINYGPLAEQILLTLVGEHEMLWGKENKMLIYFVLVAMPCVQVMLYHMTNFLFITIR